MACDMPITANAASAAAIKNDKQSMRRHGDGLDMSLGYVILELSPSIFRKIFVFIGVYLFVRKLCSPVSLVFTEVLEKIRREVMRKVRGFGIFTEGNEGNEGSCRDLLGSLQKVTKKPGIPARRVGFFTEGNEEKKGGLHST